MTHLTPEEQPYNIEQQCKDAICTLLALSKQAEESAALRIENAALAGQVVVLRDLVDRFVPSPPKLDIPQAAQQVAEWKEKAELLEWLIKERNEANLTAVNNSDAVQFTLTVKELYGPWSFEECDWDEEQILNALRAAKEGRAAREASHE